MKIVEITLEERVEYDKPLNDSDLSRLILMTLQKLNKAKSPIGVRKNRILAYKLNTIIKKKMFGEKVEI